MRSRKISTTKRRKNTVPKRQQKALQSSARLIKLQRQWDSGQNGSADKLDTFSRDAQTGLVGVPLGRWSDVYVRPAKAKRLLRLLRQQSMLE